MVSYLFNAPGLPKSRAELEALRKRRDGARPSGKMPANVGEGLSFLGQAIAARILDGKLASAESAMGAADAGLQRGLLEAAYGGGGAPDPAATAAPAGSAFPAASPRLPNEIGGPDDRPPQTDLAAGIKETAQAIGADPLDLATVISYETAGTFDPTKAGPRTQWGRHRGLIQFGEPQAKQYGVDWNDPVGSQLGANGAVASYLKAAGYQPGMGLLDMYSAVNAGRVGRYDASDANNGGAPGTVRDKVEQQMAGHRAKAMALLGAQPGPTRAAAEAMSFAPGATPPPAVEAVNAMAAGGGLPSGSDPSLRFDYSKPAANYAPPPALPTLPEPPPLVPTPTARPMTQGQPDTGIPMTPPAAAPMAGINPAGMSYDPATGKIGAGASLNAGAKAMPAARAAFLGAGAPAGPNPVRGMIENMLGGGSAPAAAPGATNPATPAAMPGASASAPGDIMQRVIAAITDPNASEATRALGMSIMQQEIERRKPVVPEYGFEFAPDGTLIRTEKKSGSINPLGRYGKPDETKPTSDMQEYGFYRQQTEAAGEKPLSFDAWMKSMKAAGRANQSVHIAGENAFDKEAGQREAQMYDALATDALQAQSDIAKIGELRQRLASSPGGILAGLQQYAASIGVPVSDNASDLQAAEAIISALVPAQRPAGSGTMSDRDIDLFRQSLPRLINTPEGNKMILDTMEAMAQYRLRQGDIAAAALTGVMTREDGRKALRSLPNPIDTFRAKAGFGRTPPAGAPGAPSADGWVTLPNGARIREVK